MALTLLSFFALAIAGFGVCQASTRLLEIPTNTLIKLGLGFFVAMAAVGFIVSQNWLPISRGSQSILLVSCCAAAVTALDFNRRSGLAPSAVMAPGFGTKHPSGERVPGEYLPAHVIYQDQR